MALFSKVAHVAACHVRRLATCIRTLAARRADARDGPHGTPPTTRGTPPTTRERHRPTSTTMAYGFDAEPHIRTRPTRATRAPATFVPDGPTDGSANHQPATAPAARRSTTRRSTARHASGARDKRRRHATTPPADFLDTDPKAIAARAARAAATTAAQARAQAAAHARAQAIAQASAQATAVADAAATEAAATIASIDTGDSDDTEMMDDADAITVSRPDCDS